MKKIYMLALLCSGVVKLCAADGLVATYTLYDLTNARMNAGYTDAQGNTFTVSTNEPGAIPQTHGTFTYFADVDNPVSCAGEGTSGLQAPVGAKYSRILLEGKSGATLARSPYFMVKFPADTKILKLQLMGLALGGASGDQELQYGFSTAASPAITASSFGVPDDVEEALTFKVGNCNYANLLIDIPAGTRTMAFIITDAFAGLGITSFTKQVEITALRFFAEAISTGVEEVKEAEEAEKTELSSTFIDLTGKPAKETAKGLLIKRTVYDDGSVGYAKVLR